MNGLGTILTPQDADDAYVLSTTVALLRAYLDGDLELEEAIKDLDSTIDNVQGDVLTKGMRRWLMIEVLP